MRLADQFRPGFSQSLPRAGGGASQGHRRPTVDDVCVLLAKSQCGWSGLLHALVGAAREERLVGHDLGHLRVGRLRGLGAAVGPLKVVAAAPIVEGLDVLPDRVADVGVAVVDVALAAEEREVDEAGQVRERRVAPARDERGRVSERFRRETRSCRWTPRRARPTCPRTASRIRA